MSERGRGGGIPSAAKGRGLVRVGKPVPEEQQHEFSSFSLYPAGTGTEGAVTVYLSLEATLLRDAAWRCQRAVKSPLLAFWVFPSTCGQRTKPGNEQQLAVRAVKPKRLAILLLLLLRSRSAVARLPSRGNLPSPPLLPSWSQPTAPARPASEHRA